MRHRLFIPAATALLFALAACTQDELADGSRLSKEEYPIVIHATGLSVEATPLAAPSTRASVDGTAGQADGKIVQLDHRIAPLSGNQSVGHRRPVQ